MTGDRRSSWRIWGVMTLSVLMTLFATSLADCMAVAICLAVSKFLASETSQRVGDVGVNGDFLVGRFNILWRHRCVKS